MKRILHYSVSSYLWMAILGSIVGLIVRLTDFFPYDDIWGFSSVATLFGFWIITAACIVYYSSSNINAGFNTFVYLFFMTLVFYFSQPVLGLFLPAFDNPFKTELFIIYALASLAAGAAGFVLYYWNRGGVLSSILYALPVGFLASEAAALFINFLNTSTWLFQLLMDLAGTVFLGSLFWKEAASKVLYIVSVLTVALAGYFFFYSIFYSMFI